MEGWPRDVTDAPSPSGDGAEGPSPGTGEEVGPRTQSLLPPLSM